MKIKSKYINRDEKKRGWLKKNKNIEHSRLF